MALIAKRSVLAKATALAMCSAAVVVSAQQADARPRHHRVAVQHSAVTVDNDGRTVVSGPALASGQTETAPRGRRARAAAAAETATGGISFGGGLVSTARSYLGTNPTGRSSLWCGAFMDMVLKKTGHAGGGNLASAYARYGTRISGPQVGAIAVMGRKGGGHVGVVSGIDANGNPIIISGNHNRTVAESTYPRGRIYAYVLPN